MDYKTSGVDIEAGREFVSEIKQAVDSTHSSNVIEGIGGFGGLFKIPLEGLKKPVLVSGTDGVGTKLELAQNKNFHFEVGIDLGLLKKALLKTSKIVFMHSNSLARQFSSMFHAKCLLPRLDELLLLRSCLQNFYQCWRSLYSQNKMVSFEYIDFWPKILLFRTHHL